MFNSHYVVNSEIYQILIAILDLYVNDNTKIAKGSNEMRQEIAKGLPAYFNGKID